MALSIRSRMKQGLKKRIEESAGRSDGNTHSYISAQGIPTWKIKEGQHLIDIIPYITGPNDPNVPQGEVSYGLELYVHRSFGPAEKDYVCLAKNYNRECPICELRKRLITQDAPEEEWKALNPKRRMLYNVVVYDSPQEEAKGVQVWEVAWWLSERIFIELCAIPTKGGHIQRIDFADPDDGKSIAFTRQGTGAQNTTFLGHKFVDRQGPIPDEILEKTYTLDKIIHIPTQEELEKVVAQVSGETSVLESTPVEEENKIDAHEVANQQMSNNRVRRSRASSLSEQDNSDVPFDVDGDKSQSTENYSQSQENFNAETPACPHGGIFGVDTDSMNQCDDCPLWDACVEAHG